MTLSNEPSRMTSSVPPRDPSRRPRILLADDDAELRGLVAGVLREDGYDVAEESDGGRLLVRISAIYAPEGGTDPIDLIISDIRMPVCTGLDILTGLRNAHWLIPVILMTAYVDSSIRARASRFGAVFLQKPFDLSRLRELVKDRLSNLAPGAALEERGPRGGGRTTP